MVIEKIKRMRGLLYRKIKEKEKEKRQKQEELLKTLPGFSIQKPSHIIEFPEVEDITKLNVIYPLLEPFAYANIKWNPELNEVVYYVLEPTLTEEEKKIFDLISKGLLELVDVELSAIKNVGKAIEYLEQNVLKVVKEHGITLSKESFLKIMYYVYRNFIGLNEIEPLMQDPNIEDLSCDGLNVPIYVVHRKYGSLRTNVMFTDEEYLRDFIVKLAERCGRYVSYAEPILDGTLPDGSRVAATLAGDVATRGPSFTIRKFTAKPLSPVELMIYKTADPKIYAYFWFLMEHGVSLLIVGGVATGKTTMLNSFCMFIKPEAKIVSIEDTRELKIPNEHWVPTLARPGFGIPLPTGEKYGGVTLFDLLKESFRQNPDYVIVGEVRGKEAYVMFQGMSSGHPSLSTMHASSVDTLIKRLTTPPIELPPTLVECLDVVVVMIHAREKGKSARRIKEVVEIESVDPETGKAKTRTVFKWDPVTDSFVEVEKSIKVEKIALAKGMKMEDVWKEIRRRRKVLERMLEKGIKDYLEFTKIVSLYYKNPQKVLEMLGIEEEEGEERKEEEEKVGEEEKEEVVVERKEEKRSIMERLQKLFGFRVVRE